MTVVDEAGQPVEGVAIEARTSIPPVGADVFINAGPTDENGQATTEAYAGQTYSIEYIEDASGTGYGVARIGDDYALTIDEDGNAETVVIEGTVSSSQPAVVEIAHN